MDKIIIRRMGGSCFALIEFLLEVIFSKHMLCHNIIFNNNMHRSNDKTINNSLSSFH